MQCECRRVVLAAILFGSLSTGSLAATKDEPQAIGTPQALGSLCASRQWSVSDRKSRDAPGCPQVVTPGLGGSKRAVLFTMKGSDLQGNTSAQHVFGRLQGDRIVVELTANPSSNSRNLGIAIRGGGQAAAY